MDYTWNVMPVYGVSTWVIVMLVVIVLLIAALVAGGCTKCQASGH